MSLEDFLSGGESVCPFAAGSNRIYAAGTDADSLLDAAAKFSATQGKKPPGALLVPGSRVDLETFHLTRIWARETFLKLMVSFGLLEGASKLELKRHVEHFVRPVLFDDKDPRRPMLACKSQPLFAICMSPVYPRTHPRYAPQPVLVVTWHADVALAGHDSPAFVERIREAMKREHGEVYDADDLMLPLKEVP